MLRFKLDENADPRWRRPLEEIGHHVSTVAGEQLQGAADPAIARVCREHNRGSAYPFVSNSSVTARNCSRAASRFSTISAARGNSRTAAPKAVPSSTPPGEEAFLAGPVLGAP